MVLCPRVYSPPRGRLSISLLSLLVILVPLFLSKNGSPQIDIDQLSSKELRIPSNYLRHKFRPRAAASASYTSIVNKDHMHNRPQCSNKLLDCTIIYDAECFHVCEGGIYHQFESCLVPLYPFLEHAFQTSQNNNNARVCLLYDANGFLGKDTSMMETLVQGWEAMAKTRNSHNNTNNTIQHNLHLISYDSQRRKKGQGQCWQIPKPGAKQGMPEENNTVCFDILARAEVRLSLDMCRGTCRGETRQQALQDLQTTLRHTWGDFVRPQNDAVVLIERPLTKRRDARAFANATAVESALRRHFGKVHVYKGQFPTFSRQAAQMFGAASSVVYYRGAGAVNVLFSSPTTVVVELFSRKCSREDGDFNGFYSNDTEIPPVNGYLRFGQRLQDLGYPCWFRLFAGIPTGGSKWGDFCKWINHVQYSQRELDYISETVHNLVHKDDNLTCRSGIEAPPLNETFRIA